MDNLGEFDNIDIKNEDDLFVSAVQVYKILIYLLHYYYTLMF